MDLTSLTRLSTRASSLSSPWAPEAALGAASVAAALGTASVVAPRTDGPRRATRSDGPTRAASRPTFMSQCWQYLQALQSAQSSVFDQNSWHGTTCYDRQQAPVRAQYSGLHLQLSMPLISPSGKEQ